MEILILDMTADPSQGRKGRGDWLGKYTPAPPRVVGRSMFTECARGEGVFDQVLAHRSDLKTSMYREQLGRDPVSSGLSTAEVVALLGTMFPRQRIRGSVWLYSTSGIRDQISEGSHVTPVQYSVPHQDESPRFRKLLETFDARFAEADQESSPLESLAPLDVLCQGFLAMAGAAYESCRSLNPIYLQLLGLRGGEGHLRRAADLADRSLASPEKWFELAMSGDEAGPGSEPINSGALWRRLAELVDSREGTIRGMVSEARPEDPLELYRPTLGAMVVEASPGRAAMLAIAKLAWALAITTDREATGSPWLAELEGSAAVVEGIEAWFSLIRDAHAGYMLLATAIPDE